MASLVVAFLLQALLWFTGTLMFRFAFSLDWWHALGAFIAVSIASGSTTMGIKVKV